MVEAEKAAGYGSRTILFVDEIHRFNKAQQDAFLPYVERGTIRLIGATTENPSFEINAALLSRCRVYTAHGFDRAARGRPARTRLDRPGARLGSPRAPSRGRGLGDDCSLRKRGRTECSQRHLR